MLFRSAPGAALTRAQARAAADALADRVDVLLAGLRGAGRAGPRLDPHRRDVHGAVPPAR